LGRSLADRTSLTEAPEASEPPTQIDTVPIPVGIGAAVDIGSNSVHLLVALVGPGWVEPLRDTSELLGLGDAVDSQGQIPLDARSRVVELLTAYADTARRSHAERLTLIGTEPLRRARNSGTLVAEIEDGTGLTVRVLSEREEAILTYVGVTRGVRPAAPLVVIDIGGGSTEVAISEPGSSLRVQSIPLGSSRLTNAIVKNDPPTHDELDQLTAAALTATAGVDSIVDQANGLGAGARAIFVGGTATNVGRLGRLTRAALAEDRKTLAALSFTQVSSRYNVKPRRARQLAAGVAIVDALLDRFGLEEAEVSEASLRDGAILCAARFGEDWHSALEGLAVNS
jgi:exopolyphosphatase/pppGpp-phosphohydrolase